MSIKSIFDFLGGRLDTRTNIIEALLTAQYRFAFQTTRSSEPWWGALLALHEYGLG